MTPFCTNDKKNHRTLLRVTPLLTCFALLATGCGAAEGSPDDAELGDSEFGDRELADLPPEDSEIGEVAQAFGESTCRSATPNVTLGAGVLSATSPNGSYNHSTCTNTYIAQKNNLSAEALTEADARATYMGGTADGTVYPCNGMWVRASLWRKVPGPTFLFGKVLDTPVVYGTPNGSGGCWAPHASIDVPADPALTDYRIMGQAGYGNVYQPVKVSFVNNPPR